MVPARLLGLECSTSLISFTHSFTPIKTETDEGGEGRRIRTTESPTGSNTWIKAHLSDAQRSLRTTPVTTTGWDSDPEDEAVGTINISD